MSLDDAIRTHSQHQLGLVTTAQLVAAGATRSAVRHREATGELIRRTRRVYRVAAVPVTELQEALAAVLDAGPGAYLDHLSGTALWELPGFFLEPFTVSRARGVARTRAELARVHELTRLPPELTTTYRGVPVLTPSFLLFQLADDLHPLRVARAMDTALAMKLASPRSLRRVLDLMARSGRNGTCTFRELVEERPVAYRPPESGNESRLRWLLDRHGEEALRLQVDSGSDEEWLGRMDFRDRELPFVLQVDSERYHGALTDAAADERQRRALEDAGYVVRRVWDTDLWHRGEVVIETVREGRRLARQLFARKAAS